MPLLGGLTDSLMTQTVVASPGDSPLEISMKLGASMGLDVNESAFLHLFNICQVSKLASQFRH